MSYTKNSLIESHLFGANDVRVFGTIEEPWFVGVDVAKCLEYKKPTDAIAKNVSADNTIELQNMFPPFEMEGRNTAPFRPELKLINECGLYELINKSKKPSAKVFQRWITNEVLPTIRKTGRYELNPPVPLTPILPLHELLRYEEETRALQIANNNSLVELFRDIGDERDMLSLKDHIRNLTFNSTHASTLSITQSENGGQDIPLTTRLGSKFNLRGRKFDDLCIPFGKVVKNRYVSIYGKEPPKRECQIKGSMRYVNSYVEKDYECFIDGLIQTHFADWL